MTGPAFDNHHATFSASSQSEFELSDVFAVRFIDVHVWLEITTLTHIWFTD